MKRTTLIATAICFALGALSAIADDKMQDGRKDAMGPDSMGKPDKMDKMQKRDAMR